MTCTCRTMIEERLTARFKEVAPEASEHKVDLQGYGFGIGPDNTMFMRPFMPYKTGAEYPLKKGGTKWKAKTGNMFFNFCPFCGERLNVSPLPVGEPRQEEGPEFDPRLGEACNRQGEAKPAAHGVKASSAAAPFGMEPDDHEYDELGLPPEQDASGVDYLLEAAMDADEILTVHVVSKDGGDYICRCPHCGEIFTTDATELDEVRGLQYKHEVRTRFGISGCGSWLEIADDARRVRELPERDAGVLAVDATKENDRA